MILVMSKPDFCIYAKTKMQISCAVTAQLISAFVSTTRIVQSLYFLNQKFQASNHSQWPCRLVCTLDKRENHSKYPKLQKKNLKCLQKNLGMPQKSRFVRVSGNETFFFCLIYMYILKMNVWPCVVCLSWQITSPGAVVGVKIAPSS